MVWSFRFYPLIRLRRYTYTCPVTRKCQRLLLLSLAAVCVLFVFDKLSISSLQLKNIVNCKRCVPVHEANKQIDIDELLSSNIASDIHENKTAFILELLKKYHHMKLQTEHILLTIGNFTNDDDRKAIHAIVKDNGLKWENTQVNPKVKRSANIIEMGTKPMYPITCSNIHNIKLKDQLGHGVTKQTYTGEFNGFTVVVKVASREQQDVRKCLKSVASKVKDHSKALSHCYVFPTRKLMKEILISEQLNHDGIARLLGYCIRNEDDVQYSTVDLNRQGIVSVFELAQGSLSTRYIRGLSWRIRIKHVLEAIDLLIYLENSPLGSLIIRDCKLNHFLRFNNTLKLIDLDDVDDLEPSCGTSSMINVCKFNLTCTNGTCKGFNARENLSAVTKTVVKHLFYNARIPSMLKERLWHLFSLADKGKISSAKIKIELMELLKMYDN